jgi:hypothetical protein
MLPYVVVNSSRLILFIYNLHLHMLGRVIEKMRAYEMGRKSTNDSSRSNSTTDAQI